MTHDLTPEDVKRIDDLHTRICQFDVACNELDEAKEDFYELMLQHGPALLSIALAHLEAREKAGEVVKRLRKEYPAIGRMPSIHEVNMERHEAADTITALTAEIERLKSGRHEAVLNAVNELETKLWRVIDDGNPPSVPSDIVDAVSRIKASHERLRSELDESVGWLRMARPYISRDVPLQADIRWGGDPSKPVEPPTMLNRIDAFLARHASKGKADE